MRTVLLCAVVALLAACGRGTDTMGLSDERFVSIVVELRRAADLTRREPDTYPARRDSILDAAGVTEAQLRSYIDAHAEDLQHMAGIWADINRRLGEAPPP